jgi:hypothetical protein
MKCTQEAGEPDVICGLSISFHLEADGLVGGEYEYDPYVSIHTSFGKHRIPVKDNLEPIKRTCDTETLSSSTSVMLNSKKKKKGNVKVTEAFKEITMSESILSYRSSKNHHFELPGYDKMRGDDMIRFKLFAKTDYSGVDSIDKLDKGNVKREMACGVTSISLYDIFKYLKEMCRQENIDLHDRGRLSRGVTFTVNDHFYDDAIVEEKIRDLMKEKQHRRTKEEDDEEEEEEYKISDTEYMVLKEKARQLTQEASITYTVTVHDLNLNLYKMSIHAVDNLKETGTHAFLSSHYDSSSSSSSFRSHHKSFARLSSSRVGEKDNTCHDLAFEPLLYNSKKEWKSFLVTTNGFLEEYCRNFLQTDDNYKSLYQPSEVATSNLQLAMFNAPGLGKMPVVFYFAGDEPFFRPYASEEAQKADLERYGFGDDSEECMLLILRSSLRRHGLSEKTFVKCIDDHFCPNNRSTYLSPHFTIAEEVIADVGTFTANTAYYTADYRYMNTSNSFDGHKHKDLGEAHHCVSCGKKLKVKIICIDSWDNDILCNASKCDDCEVCSFYFFFFFLTSI